MLCGLPGSTAAICRLHRRRAQLGTSGLWSKCGGEVDFDELAGNAAPNDDQLMKYMADDRALEVHESGSGRNATVEYSAISGNTYSDDSGVLTVFAPPGTSPGAIVKPAYYFTIGGANKKVTEACAEYLTLLDQMIADFKAAHP